MIDRVHGHAAIVRTAPHPALAAGLADRRIHVIGVRHRPDARHAAAEHETLLARIQPQDDVVLVAPDDLRVGTGRARELTALADLELDIVDDRADRHVRHRHRIAGLHVDMLARDHNVADRETLRREDVGQLAVVVLQQRDEAGAVRIVFEPLDLGRHVELAALEIDLAIGLLMAAAAIARGNVAVIVSPAGRIFAFGQRLDRLALVERRTIDEHQLALARRDRVEVFECHCVSPYKPVVTSMR